MNRAWYVIQSKPRKEPQLFAYLESQGYEVFFPTLHVKPVNPRASTIRPYFPRYLFVHTNIAKVGVNDLKWAPFSIGLVEFDGYAAPVPDSVIYEIRRRIDQIKAVGGIQFDGLQQGDPVRITHGPLAGYEAIFDMRLSGSDRVQVLLEMLGRQVRTQVHAGAIEKHQPRRNR